MKATGAERLDRAASSNRKVRGRPTRVGDSFGLAIRSTLKARAWVEATVPKVFGEWMPGAKWTVAVGFAVNYFRLSISGGLLRLCKQRLVRATACLEATRQDGYEPKDTKAKNHLLCKGGARATAMKCVVGAAKAFVRRDIPLVCRNCTGDGKALNHAIPSVNVTGASRLHRAASSDRRERGRPAG